jgi:hypothetical protein
VTAALREVLPALFLAGAAGLASRAGLPLAPLAVGAGLCLLLAAARALLRAAAARAGLGGREPGQVLERRLLLGAEWVAALAFGGIALAPLLPDRRLPAAAAVAGTAVLILLALGEGRRRRVPPPRGSECHWKGGLVYLNPRDRRPLVPARLGPGYTVNLGRPLGWALLLAALVPPVLLAAWLARALP